MYPSPGLKAQLYLKELYVHEGHRGKGAGRTLMKFVARYALAHGCNRMDWSAEKTNPAALEFYEAVGAKPLAKKVYYRLADGELESFANK
jgi:GNAT superfamily N-acetyltransferase